MKVKRFAKCMAFAMLFNSLNFSTVRATDKPEEDKKSSQQVEITTLEADYVTTGTAPFNEGSGAPQAGEDYSDKDSYVRSFDEITYDLTMSVNDKLKTAPVVEVTAELPKINTSTRNMVEWNTDNLPKGTFTLSEDKTILTFDIDDMTPGKMYTKGLVVKVLSANNGQVITPTFTAKIKGNDVTQKSINAKRPVTVSAQVNFDTSLVLGEAHVKTTHNGVNGRLLQVGMLGSSLGKLINAEKGIAFPEGNISVDLKLKTIATNLDTKETKEIQLDAQPFFVGDVESEDPLGNKMFSVFLPYSNGGNIRSVEDTGNVKLSKVDNSTFRITYDSYKIGNTFPHLDCNTFESAGIKDFPTHCKPFLSNILEIFIPFYADKEGSYDITASLEISKVLVDNLDTSLDTVESNKNFNKVSVNLPEYLPGIKSISGSIISKEGEPLETPYWSGGNSKILPNQEFRFDAGVHLHGGADAYEGGSHVMSVFNGHNFEYIGRPQIDYSSAQGGLLDDYSYYYGVGNITNEQVINANPSMFEWFSSLEEAKANETSEKKVSAVMLDLRNSIYGVGNLILKWRYYLKAKSDITVEEAVPFRVYANLFVDKDRTNSTGWLFKDKYIPSKYDTHGDIIHGTHTPAGVGGCTALVIPYEVDVTIGTNKSVYDLSQGNIIDWNVNPRVDVYNPTDITDTVYIKHTIPSDLKILADSFNIKPIEIVDSGINKELYWEFKNVNSEVNLPSIKYKTEISMNTLDRTKFNSIATTYTTKDKRDIRFRTYNHTISVINDASFKIVKNVDKALVDTNEAFNYTLTWSNNSNKAYNNGKMLDILPFNNDNNGSIFTGDYVVEEFTEPNSVTLEYTNTDPTTIKDDALNSGVSDWRPLENGVKATAIRISVPSIEKHTTENVTLKIKPNGNKGKDLYKNRFTARVEGLEAKLLSNVVETKVRTYALEGVTWYDLNRNGVIDADETKLQNIPVKLLDTEGNPVLDSTGQAITTTSNAEGLYQFEILEQGIYRTMFELPNGTKTTTLMPTDNLSGNHTSLQTIKELPAYISEPKEVKKGYVYTPRLNLGVVPALALQKSVDKTLTNVGDILAYSLTVTNTSTVGSPLMNIPLEDTVPTGLEVIENSISDEGVLEGNKIKWNINDLSNGQSKTVTFRCKVVDENLTTIKNVAIIPGTDIKDEVVSSVIKYSKSSNPEAGTEVKEGQEVTYNITVNNPSEQPVTNITITDTVPQGTMLVKDSISDKGKLVEDTITWSIKHLNAGETKTVSFKVTVDKLPVGVTSGEIRNIATVNGNNTNEVIHPVKNPNLQSIKNCTVPSDKVLSEGDEIGYSISITNTGEAISDKIIVTDNVPVGTTLIDSSISNGGVFENGTITWELNPLDIDESVEVSFKVTVNKLAEGKTSAQIENTAVVNGTSTNKVTNVVQVAKIQASKSSEPVTGSTVKVGDKIKYSIKIDNTGDAPSKVVTITDSIPIGTTIVDGSISDKGVLENGAIKWTINSVQAKQSVTVSFEVTVNELSEEQFSTEIRNTALVNDVKTNETIHYVKEPNLEISKESNPPNGSTVEDDSDITYTIKVVNTGEGVAKDVSIKDIVPKDTTLLKVNNEGVVTDNTIEWKLPEIKAGETKSVSFVVKVNKLPQDKPTNTIKNIATVNDKETNEVIHNIVSSRFITEKQTSVNGSVKVGDKITYSIKVTNTGSTELKNLTITDKVPNDTKLVLGSISNKGKFKDGTITWNIPKLKQGESVVVKFKVEVLETASGKVVKNVATVNSTKTNEVENNIEVKVPGSEDKLPGTGTLPLKTIPVVLVIGTAIVAWKRFRK